METLYLRRLPSFARRGPATLGVAELRKRLDIAQKRQEEYMAKRAEAGAEPSRRDRGAEPSEEPRAPSPPGATAAAGSSAVPVQGEARGFSLTLRGWDSRRRSEGIILRFV